MNYFLDPSQIRLPTFKKFFEYSKYNMIIINKLHKNNIKKYHIFLILAFYIFVNQKHLKFSIIFDKNISQ